MKRLLFLSALFSSAVFGQTNLCSFNFLFDQNTGFVSQPSPTAFDNRLKGCNSFTMTYQAIGLSAVNVQLNSATGAATQGTFGAYSGTTFSGTNPLTSTTGDQAVFTGYVGWLQVAVTGTPSGATWRIQGTVTGSQTGVGPAVSNTSCPAATPCQVNVKQVGGTATDTNSGNKSAGTERVVLADDQPLGTTIAVKTQGFDAASSPPTKNPNLGASFDGTNVRTNLACIMQAVTVLAPGTTGKIITNTGGGKKAKICHVHETSGTTSANVTIRSGTGSQCAAGTSTIDGIIGTTGFAFDFGPQSPLSGTAANDDICMDFSTSVTATILVIYTEASP